MKLDYYIIVYLYLKKYWVCICINIDIEEVSIKLKRFWLKFKVFINL